MFIVQAKSNNLISKKIKLSNTFLKKIFLRDKVYERVKNTLLCTLKSKYDSSLFRYLFVKKVTFSIYGIVKIKYTIY